MPKVIFIPGDIEIEVNEGTKLLVAGTKSKAPIRYGCASCRCGTCGVAVAGDAELTEMGENERALLERMKLALDGTVRLACQARIMAGTCTVDLDFQDSYSPDQGDE